MKNLQYLLAIALLFGAYSCATSEGGEENESDMLLDGTGYRESYIYTFVTPSELELEVYSNGDVLLRITGDEYHYSGSTSEQHSKYAQIYGDTYYNTRAVPYDPVAYTEQFDYVNVTCKTDFNAEHSAGALLNDIINIYFVQYYDFVQSGYIYPTDSKVDALISEVNNVGYKLISSNDDKAYILTFNESPTTAGEYTFDIELKMGDSILTGEITKEF